MGLNTNNFQSKTRDFGSERAQTQKLIAKALKAKGLDPALEKLKRTVESLPKPEGWTMQREKVWDWTAAFSRASIMMPAGGLYTWDVGTISIDAPARESWRDREPQPWRPEFRRQAVSRGFYGAESQYMRQTALKFPPVEESDFFRIEHEHDLAHSSKIFGVGPYQRSYQLDHVPYSEQCPDTGDDLTPGPYSDGELLPALRDHGHELTSLCYFGFSSIEAMKSWFRAPQFWASLKPAGYVVRHYRGIVFKGRRQSVIDSQYPVKRLEVVEV